MRTDIERSLLKAELNLSERIIEKFIGSCSHDLKSPLCSIEGLLAIMSKYSATPEVQECHTLINQCVSNMKKMLLSLEDYTMHLQAELKETEIHAEEMIEDILNQNLADIQSASVQVILNIEQSGKWISDEYCNYLILSNLIHNAIVFSDSEKTIRRVNIELQVHVDHVEIEIGDNGIGIEATQQGQLFEPFNRGSSIKCGAGLGLFLVKGMVNKLGATISVLSEEKIGTVVHLNIPNHQSKTYTKTPTL